MQRNIIAGFPGVGKSYLFNETDIKVTDSDSSKFDKKDFPNNYISHIQNKLDEGYTVLSSTHDDVRKAFVENNMPFYLVYPDIRLKDEYIERYKKRGESRRIY